MNTANRDRLITEHLEMASACAFGAAAQFNLLHIVSRDDIHACARQALVEAADRFDPDRGVDFRAYSRRRIRGAVIDAARKHRLEGYSRKLHEKFKAVDAQQQEAPSGYRAQIFYDSFCLDRCLPSSSKTEAADFVPSPPHRDPAHAEDAPDAQVDRLRLRKTLLEAINTLPPRERAVTLRHYYDGDSFCAIGAEEGVDNQVIRRLHNKSLRRLREALGVDGEAAMEVLQ